MLLGSRIRASGRGVGSLLLGLYDDSGEARTIGGASGAKRQATSDKVRYNHIEDARFRHTA